MNLLQCFIKAFCTKCHDLTNWDYHGYNGRIITFRCNRCKVNYVTLNERNRGVSKGGES